MDDREQQRKIRHRLAVLRHVEEVSGNVAAMCRYCGISRTVFYKWRNRFDELGPEGLRDRSSRPHNSPTATKGEAAQHDWRIFSNQIPYSRGFPKMMRGDHRWPGRARESFYALEGELHRTLSEEGYLP